MGDPSGDRVDFFHERNAKDLAFSPVAVTMDREVANVLQRW
jgi:hypothetical protein